MKKFISLLLCICTVAGLCACGGKEEPGTTTQAVSTTAKDAFEPFVIAKENAQRIENPVPILTYEGEEYSVIEYNGRNYISKELASGNLKAVYKFETDFVILQDATERAGGRFIYFTAGSEDKVEALYAYYLPTGVAMKIVEGPCSNFVMLQVPDTYEMYPYGFIVTASQINVINLQQGDISSYSRSVADVNIYLETPEYFFMGDTVSTEISAFDRAKILVKVTDKSGKEVKETLFTFHPITGIPMIAD